MIFCNVSSNQILTKIKAEAEVVPSSSIVEVEVVVRVQVEVVYIILYEA